MKNLTSSPTLPIRLRLTLWYVALLAVMLFLFGGVLLVSVYMVLDRQVTQELESVASSVRESVQLVADTRAQPAQAPVTLPTLDAFGSPDTFIELRSADGNVQNRSDNLGEQSLDLPQETFNRAENGLTTINDVRGPGGSSIRIFTQPIFDDGELINIVQVGKPLVDITRTIRQLLVLVVISIVGALLSALVIGAWMAQRALSPVDQVTQTALRISNVGDLHERLPDPGTQDEIGRLVRAFNEMLGRLDDVFRDQQRFVADVSHELRTPLTALQGTIDLLKRGALDDPDDRESALVTIESEVARLNRLVADLLLLARADEGGPLQTEPVELDTLMLEVFLQAKTLAKSSGKPITVKLGHEDQAIVRGDRDRLKQAMLNLIDNAIKYTRDGEVTLSLYREDGWARCTVEDTGIGIPPDAIPHLFRRFYRVDKARSRELGGTGLGLAIVQWITESHGGYVDVESEVGEGSRFTMHLPTADVGRHDGSPKDMPVDDATEPIHMLN